MNEKQTYRVVDLEDLQLRMRGASALIDVIREAMDADGDVRPRYIDALCGAHSYMEQLADEMQAMADAAHAAHAARRKECEQA